MIIGINYFLRLLSVFLFVIEITTTDLFGLTSFPKEYPDTFINKVYDPHLQTVFVSVGDRDFSLPVWELQSENLLQLHFDDLSGESRTFGYTLVHCDMNWKASDLSESEYLSGFGSGIITETEQSFNTNFFYIHHSLKFPIEECYPVISGNYALVVYSENDPDRIVMTRRFFVTEKTMSVEASVRQPAFGKLRETGQQVHFSVLFNNTEIRDPRNEISAVVIQNNRFDRTLTFKQPYMQQPGRADFTDPGEGIFTAGNEFRTVDLKSMRYQTENIAEIDFRSPYFHVIMKPDMPRSDKPWFSKADLNGNYYIDKEKSDRRHIEADYVFVHFNLRLPLPYSEERVFVTGEMNDWQCDEGSLMKFNPETGLFELTLRLKQGLYDYGFFTESPENGIKDETEIEGSFYETENDYSIFVYFHDQFKRYDRLTACLLIK